MMTTITAYGPNWFIKTVDDRYVDAWVKIAYRVGCHKVELSGSRTTTIFIPMTTKVDHHEDQA